jgi:predicted alpha-1,6-mannanase (GH76 family)
MSSLLNRFYDDEGWWALAWIDAYDWTQNPDYLNTAQAIFTDMTGGWDDVCGGGIWWSKDRTYTGVVRTFRFGDGRKPVLGARCAHRGG